MTMLQTNIDDIRTEIMRLESAPTFDAMAWSRVLAAMSDRPAGLADTKRRMETAMGNQLVQCPAEVLEMDSQPKLLPAPTVATETAYAS